MRYLLLPLLVLGSVICNAKKDICKDLIYRPDKMRGSSSLSSPNGTAVVSRWIKDTDTTYNLVLVIFEKYSRPVMVSSSGPVGDDGVYLLFDDGSTYRSDSTAVIDAVIASKTARTATLTITEELKEKLTHHKLTKIGLGSVSKEVPEVTGGRLGDFLNCLYPKTGN